jgi:membrane protein YqaA with SNARE-associated domain
MSVAAELVSLFAAAFLAATLLPGSSEVALAASLKLGAAPAWASIASATMGNTAGSIVNWALGRFGARFRDHPRFPVTPAQFERGRALYARWGVWTLLLSWLPVVGDPLTVAAGLMRTPLLLFIPLVTIGKLARYLLVAGAMALL